MHRTGARYRLEKIAVLWEEIDRVVPDPCFGLAAASNLHPSNFGTLGYAMLTSSTLRDTLQRLIRFHRVISDAHFAELTENTDQGTLEFSLVYEDEKPYPRAREDTAIALIMSVLRMNYVKDLTPVSVRFTHEKPDCAARYYEFFHAPVTFNAPTCGLSLPLEVVDRKLPSAHDELAAFNDEIMTQYLNTLEDTELTSSVQRFIVQHLPSGTATVDRAANKLFLSVRKLQRLLQLEGTSFIALLNKTRKEIAKQYVLDKKLDLTEVAFLLGFSELSSFSRSFKRWTGKSPVQFRSSV
jgi:AraC-like DNA-binding protein